MFKVGDKVSIKTSMVRMAYGWGKMFGNVKEVGIISDVSGYQIKVNFPSQRDFLVRSEELDYHDKTTPDAVKRRIILAKEKLLEGAVINKLRKSIPKEDIEAAGKFLDLWGESDLGLESKYVDLWYKREGKSGWKKQTSCYSFLCHDFSYVMVKASEGNKFTKSQQRFISSLLKGVGKRVRDSFKDHPVDWAESTAWFGSGRAYNNYFSFVLWRMLLGSPKLVLLMQYFRRCGFNTAQSYYLLSKFSGDMCIGQFHIVTANANKGTVKRLIRCGSYVGKIPYTMGKTISGVINSPFIKATDYKTLKMSKSNLSKYNLNRLLKEA